MNPAIKMQQITKTFPGVVANDNIVFTAKKGQVHGLLGENGAGKSVLMNILYGLYQPDHGKIFIDDKRVIVSSPSEAMRLGIGMVHQHFMLVPSLTVAENIVLGREPRKNGVFLDEEKMYRDVLEFCKRYRLVVDPHAPVHSLSVGVQQRVEILKALYRGADILILDEPTAVLTPGESLELFNAIRAFKEEGKTVIFISHKLKEVLAICDQITILKNGRVIGTVEASETSEEALAEMMVGRKIVYELEKGDKGSTRVVLDVMGVSAIDDQGVKMLKGLSLRVNDFEIMGLAGVMGNGQSELIEVLIGLRRVSSGVIMLMDDDITYASPGERIKLGVSHVPEDRLKRGIVPGFSVQENLILGSHKTVFSKNGVILDQRAAELFSEEMIGEYSISVPSRDTLLRYLSGGNQQRVVVAREFSREPRLIIAAQPTRGLDVGATEYVRKRLIEMRDDGSAVLLISADLEEILMLSDRVAVIYEGEIVVVKKIEDIDEREIGLLMAGGSIE